MFYFPALSPGRISGILGSPPFTAFRKCVDVSNSYCVIKVREVDSEITAWKVKMRMFSVNHCTRRKSINSPLLTFAVKDRDIRPLVPSEIESSSRSLVTLCPWVPAGLPPLWFLKLHICFTKWHTLVFVCHAASWGARP